MTLIEIDRSVLTHECRVALAKMDSLTITTYMKHNAQVRVETGHDDKPSLSCLTITLNLIEGTQYANHRDHKPRIQTNACTWERSTGVLWKPKFSIPYIYYRINGV